MRKEARTRVDRTEVNRVVLPYIKNTSEAAARLLKQHNIEVSHRPSSTLKNILTNVKDKMEEKEKSKVVYSVSCKNCTAEYIGQTAKQLKVRCEEHQRAVNRKDPSSAVASHCHTLGHQMNWEEARVLARGERKKQREFLEAWMSGEDSINRRIDLSDVYARLRN